jgi:hypothetical protein
MVIAVETVCLCRSGRFRRYGQGALRFGKENLFQP